jgi:hypothetical protein
MLGHMTCIDVKEAAAGVMTVRSDDRFAKMSGEEEAWRIDGKYDC